MKESPTQMHGSNVLYRVGATRTLGECTHPATLLISPIWGPGPRLVASLPSLNVSNRLQVLPFAFWNHLPVVLNKMIPRVRNFSLHLPRGFCPSLGHSKVWQAAGLDKAIYQNVFAYVKLQCPIPFFTVQFFFRTIFCNNTSFPLVLFLERTIS